MAEKVKKRDGRIEDFDLKKIENAIHKGFVAVGLKDKDRGKEKSRELALNVSKKSRKKCQLWKRYRIWLKKP
jgi:ATP cone domain.